MSPLGLGAGLTRTKPRQGDSVWPSLLSIGNVDTSTVEATFTAAIISPGADYSAGVTIKQDTVAATISSATRQTNHRVVYYVLAAPADSSEVITFAYDKDTGDVKAEVGSRPLKSIIDRSVINYIGSHIRFSQADNSGHLATLGV